MVRMLVRTLLTLAALLGRQRIALAELAGATAGVVALVVIFGAGGGWAGVSVALLAKSFEWDLAKRSKSE